MARYAYFQDSGVAAVDLGKTKTAVAVFSGGARTDLPSAGGAPGLSAPDGPAAAMTAIEAALPDGAPDVIVGAAGALAAPNAADHLARALADRPGVHRSAVTSDAITAHLGALAGRAGVVLIAGTGAVAVAVTPDGEVRLVDGAGPEQGDCGSGGWIGMAALRLAVSGAAGAAVQAAIESTLGEDWPALAARTDAAAAAERGRLVPALAAAWQAGDAQAAEIFDRAATQLGATVRDAALEPVTIVGGLTALGPPFLDLLRSKTGVSAWVDPAGDALDGAALLADRTDLPHEALVHRCAR